MEQKPISADIIAKLLKEEKTPQKPKAIKIPYRDPGPVTLDSRGPFRRANSSLKCARKLCGTETWMTFDRVPYCWIHGIMYLNDMVVTLTDRLEKTYLQRGTGVTVVGELMGNYEKGDKVSEAENEGQNETSDATESAEPVTGNQSEEDVARIQADEAGASNDEDEDDGA